MYRFRKKYTESNFVLIVIDANRFFLFHIHIDKKEEGRNRIKLSIFLLINNFAFNSCVIIYSNNYIR